MPPLQTETRPFSVSGPLDPDTLLLLRMTGNESLGRLFHYELELLSTRHDITMSDVLGQHMTVKARVRNNGTRYFDGIVSRFSYVGGYGRFARYEATLRPWFWFLSRSADCRIFQGDSTVDIMKKIFGDRGFSDLDLTRISAPAPRDYCTQYRESDFAFLSRLMEHDGIYYYFQHEDGKHKLVLADGARCHDTVDGYEEIPCFPEGSEHSPDADRFLQWYLTQEFQTGVFSHTDYDFTKPKATLETRGVITRDNTQSRLEVFDYPGYYDETSDGETIARTRIEELQALFEVAHGGGTVRGLGAGSLFRMTEHPRQSFNKGYLVVSASYELSNPEYETGIGGRSNGPAFTTHITAIDEQTQFRPARLTPRPIVEGPQTAIVTGSGDDVWTDEYGRIKVHFHWDRHGSSDETSSCFVRVSQNWAGKNWGGMFLPHIGQEVIISFLEGDPDLPVCTGRVYNQDNMPPLTLPDHKLSSIIRDDYGNQLMFNATPGDEHIVLQSPHHASTIILGKSGEWQTKSDTKYFTNGTSMVQTIGSTLSTMLGNSFSFTGGASESVTIGASVSMMVGFKVDINAATKLAADVGGAMTFNYNYSYKWGWSAETNVNKKQFLRSSGSDIIHDSLKHVMCVGGPKDNSIMDCGDTALNLSFGEDPGAGSENPAAISAGRAIMATLTGAAAAAAAAGTAYGAGLRSLASAWNEGNVAGRTPDDSRAGSPLALGTPYLETLAAGTGTAIVAWAATFAQMKSVMDAAGKKRARQTTKHSEIDMKEDTLDIIKHHGASQKSYIKLKDQGIEVFAKDNDIQIKTSGQIILDAAGGVIIKKNKMKTQDSSHTWNM
ncbi:MAG: type VI secretion system tip protein TssI/VgrG [Candidatus Eisenbacteria bacterium]